LERSSADWDYGLFGVNYIHPELLKSGKWQPAGVVKTFLHKENPLVVVVKRTDKNDFKGIEMANSGDWVQSSVLLENALQTDKNNVWIILQLAKNSLKLNDFERFNTYLQQGRSIYVDYEPFYLLEAQYFFDLGKTEEAKVVLNKLIDVNPRYQNAAPLLNAVNKKLEEHKFNN
jgi:tetratricopeptide (TPR) repeat protein